MRYTGNHELCNNATPYRPAKTTTCSGQMLFRLQDSRIIMQQSRCRDQRIGSLAILWLCDRLDRAEHEQKAWAVDRLFDPFPDNGKGRLERAASGKLLAVGIAGL